MNPGVTLPRSNQKGLNISGSSNFPSSSLSTNTPFLKLPLKSSFVENKLA